MNRKYDIETLLYLLVFADWRANR